MDEGGPKGNFFQLVFWCGEWTLHCSLSMNLIFGGEAGVKGKSSQVPDMFLKEFPIAPHIYRICFGKCCPHFTYIDGPKRQS